MECLIALTAVTSVEPTQRPSRIDSGYDILDGRRPSSIDNMHVHSDVPGSYPARQKRRLTFCLAVNFVDISKTKISDCASFNYSYRTCSKSTSSVERI